MFRNFMIKKWTLERIDSNLCNLSDYTAIIEDLLAHKLKEINFQTDKAESELTKEEQQDYDNPFEDDQWHLSEVFPNTLRFSLFVTCYSLLEYALINLCASLQEQHKYPNKFGDHKEKGIFEAKTYLKDTCHVSFPDQTNSWNKIVYYYHIRNFIVHSEGRLDDGDKTKKVKMVKSFIKAHPSLITLDNLERIQLSKDFCPEAIETLKIFFMELFKTVP